MKFSRLSLGSKVEGPLAEASEFRIPPVGERNIRTISELQQKANIRREALRRNQGTNEQINFFTNPKQMRTVDEAKTPVVEMVDDWYRKKHNE